MGKKMWSDIANLLTHQIPNLAECCFFMDSQFVSISLTQGHSTSSQFAVFVTCGIPSKVSQDFFDRAFPCRPNQRERIRKLRMTFSQKIIIINCCHKIWACNLRRYTKWKISWLRLISLEATHSQQQQIKRQISKNLDPRWFDSFA